jgi:hypothetical protein
MSSHVPGFALCGPETEQDGNKVCCEEGRCLCGYSISRGRTERTWLELCCFFPSGTRAHKERLER